MILEESGNVFGRIVEKVYLNAVNNGVNKMITIPINIENQENKNKKKKSIGKTTIEYTL